jgi:AP-2 complex subunit sigma-1
MIRFILLQNRAGKTRLAKYYVPLDDVEKRNLEYEVHRLISQRDAKFTNFVEVKVSEAFLGYVDGLKKYFTTAQVSLICCICNVCRLLCFFVDLLTCCAPYSLKPTRSSTGAMLDFTSACA